MLKIEGSNPLHGLFLLTRTEFINDFPYFHLCGQTDRQTDRQTKISSRVYRKQVSRHNLKVAAWRQKLSFLSVNLFTPPFRLLLYLLQRTYRGTSEKPRVNPGFNPGI